MNDNELRKRDADLFQVLVLQELRSSSLTHLKRSELQHEEVKSKN